MSQVTTSTGRTCVIDDPEVDLVREIEAGLLPPRCHGWPGGQVAAKRIASALGGDFHNVISGPEDRHSLVVGTVAGPGLFAALAKTAISSAVRKFGRVNRSSRTMIGHLRSLLDRINAGLRSPRVTCSLFHALVDRSGGTLEYCNAGHCHAFVWMRSGEMHELQDTGPTLGTRTQRDDDCGSFDLSALQRLIVLTAGLTTACSASGELFGIARGKRLLNDTVRLPADQQIDAVVRTLREHVGPDSMLTEDATVFVTEFEEDVAHSEAGAATAWLRTCEQELGTVPDSSIYLG